MATKTDERIPKTNELTPKQHKTIAALLATPTIAAAAAVVSVGERTVHTWLGERTFADAYRDARRAAVTQAVTRLQQVSGVAVGVLVQVMANKDNPASTRVNAAKTVLEFAFRAVELEDIQARLDALEQAGTP
jgi:hypothetical protein